MSAASPSLRAKAAAASVKASAPAATRVCKAIIYTSSFSCFSSFASIVMVVVLHQTHRLAGLGKREPAVLQSLLLDAGPRPVACTESHLVIGGLKRLELALEDVARARAARDDARVGMHRKERVAYARVVEIERMVAHHPGRVPALVLEALRLVADHLREVRPARS